MLVLCSYTGTFKLLHNFLGTDMRHQHISAIILYCNQLNSGLVPLCAVSSCIAMDSEVIRNIIPEAG